MLPYIIMDLPLFIVEYNPRGPNIQEIIKRHLNVLQENPDVKKIFPDGSIIVPNKRCKSLKELLARADPFDVREDFQIQLGDTRYAVKSVTLATTW